MSARGRRWSSRTASWPARRGRRAPPRSRPRRSRRAACAIVGIGVAAGQVGIGAGLALEGDQCAVMRRFLERISAGRSAGALQIGGRVDAERAALARGRSRCACRPPARATAPASRAAPAATRAARRSAPARRGDRRRCRCGASAGRRPRGSSAGEIQRPRRRRAGRNSTGGLDDASVAASASGRMGDDQRADIDLRGRPAARARRAGWRPAGWRISPCRFTTTSCAPAGSSSASAASTRSEPDGRAGSVSTALPPAARTAAAISASPQATATGPSRPRAAAPACARSSARRRCRPAACRAAGWRPCARG